MRGRKIFLAVDEGTVETVTRIINVCFVNADCRCLSFDPVLLLLKCCFTSTETAGLLGTGAQHAHLDFHTESV